MKKIIVLASITSLSLIISLSSQAEIYKWVDENGGVHYTATPPQQKKKRIKATDIADEIRAKAGKYRPPSKSESSADQTSNSGEESKNSEDTNLAGPDKKLIEYCKNQKNNLVQLKKNFRNVWIDVKGKKTNLTQEQRKEKVDYLMKRIAEDCADVKS